MYLTVTEGIEIAKTMIDRYNNGRQDTAVRLLDSLNPRQSAYVMSVFSKFSPGDASMLQMNLTHKMNEGEK